ncbi:MAG: hypothetical protein WAL40_19000 [Rhodoplanes sp.]
MSAVSNDLILDLIKRHCRPSDTHEEFSRGLQALGNALATAQLGDLLLGTQVLNDDAGDLLFG